MNKLLGWVYFLCLCSPALASSFNEKCPDIPTCAKVVGELLGQKYLYDSDLRGHVSGTPNLELNRDNAELLFSQMLDMEGYTRVPAGQPDTFRIMRQRDARDSAIPLVTADQKSAPNLPNTWDMTTLRYKATHSEGVEQIARMSRSFMPANSRIIPSEVDGSLLVTDSAANLKKLYAIIRELDQKPSPEQLKAWKERETSFHARYPEKSSAHQPDPQASTPATKPDRK